MQYINSYLTALQEYWQTNNVNNLTLAYYDTMADLQSYIGNENYLSPNEGICFGLQVVLNTNGTYTAMMIMDDQN
jgi:hypothetical protein